MSKILVTGGAGFIGSHTARKLIERGDQVTIIDDFNNRYDPTLKQERIELMFSTSRRPTVIKADVADYNKINKIFSEYHFDAVIHLAAWADVSTSLTQPMTYARANIIGTNAILEAARRAGTGVFIFASSSSVYGDKAEVPFRETDDITRPVSPYAASKSAGEILCSTWHYLYQVPTTCLRFFNVYGPWGRPDQAIYIFTRAIMNNKTIAMRGRDTARDFTYIDDCVNGIIAALDKASGFKVINLGAGDAVPLARFISALETATGIKAKINEVPLPPGEMFRTLADISRARDLLAYQPTTSVEDGVKLFTDWYVRHVNKSS